MANINNQIAEGLLESVNINIAQQEAYYIAKNGLDLIEAYKSKNKELLVEVLDNNQKMWLMIKTLMKEGKTHLPLTWNSGEDTFGLKYNFAFDKILGLNLFNRELFEKEVDYRANVHNKSAEEFYKKCGTKVLEPSFEKQKPNREIELMRCKHCIKYALNMCKSPKKLVLIDEYGKKYPLKFDCKKCEMSILT